MGKKLGEMASGLKVHLTATAGLEQLEFETSVVQAGEGHIIVEPVKHNGKILNFSNSSIIKNVVVDAQPLPEKYINVDVEITMLENKKYHIYSVIRKEYLSIEEMNSESMLEVMSRHSLQI